VCAKIFIVCKIFAKFVSHFSGQGAEGAQQVFSKQVFPECDFTKQKSPNDKVVSVRPSIKEIRVRLPPGLKHQFILSIITFGRDEAGWCLGQKSKEASWTQRQERGFLNYFKVRLANFFH